MSARVSTTKRLDSLLTLVYFLLKFVVEFQFEEVLAVDLSDIVNNVLVVQQVRLIHASLLAAFPKGDLCTVNLRLFLRIGRGFSHTFAAVLTFGQLFDVVRRRSLIPTSDAK